VLLLLVATYVVASLTHYRGWSAVAIAALGCTAGVLALASAGAKPATARIGAAIAAGSVGSALVAALSGADGFLAAAALAETLLLMGAVGALLRAVLGETQVGFRTILGAVSVYMIFGILFSSLYVAIDRLQSGQFFESRPPGTGDFIFFSFTTLTTTGYGNLVPAAQPGRMFAGLEMLLGQIFVVTLIAGLVSLWRPRQRER
jgi:hypothetical protein